MELIGKTDAQCYECGTTFRLFVTEWPPKVVVCPNWECGTALGLLSYEAADQIVTFAILD